MAHSTVLAFDPAEGMTLRGLHRVFSRHRHQLTGSVRAAKSEGFGVERFAKLEDAISILGVPVPVVEIQVSLKKKIAWIVLLNCERKSASKDFPLDAWLGLEESARTVENLGKDLIKAMRVRGLIDDASRVTVTDVDSQPVQ